MKVKIVAGLVYDEQFDPEREINRALRDGWYLKDTHTVATPQGNIWLVAVLVDHVAPLEVNIDEMPGFWSGADA